MSVQISFIVPNRDSPLVGRTIQALHAQELGSLESEILVVGSDAPRLISSASSVRLIETPVPLNPAAARNLGAEHAVGDLLLFTDADCRPQEDWAIRLIRRLRQHPVVGGSVRFSLTGNCWAVADNIASFHELLEDRSRGSADEHPLGTLNLGIQRQAWREVGGFDEELTTSEDYDWVLRARQAGLEAYFEPMAVVEHADVRSNRRELVDHATWYGTHFHTFRRKHPEVFASGPTWATSRRLASVYPLKALAAALAIYGRHSALRTAWRALPGVVIFKLAWYRAVLDNWPDA